jgi:hypothetical protein
MKDRHKTIAILIGVVVLLVAWDIYAYTSPDTRDTISEVVLGFSQDHPAVGIAFGILLGHILWPQRIKEK